MSETALCFAQKNPVRRLNFFANFDSQYPNMLISILLFEWNRSGLLNAYG